MRLERHVLGPFGDVRDILGDLLPFHVRDIAVLNEGVPVRNSVMAFSMSLGLFDFMVWGVDETFDNFECHLPGNQLHSIPVGNK